MLFLLFVHSLAARALPVPAANDETAPTSCTDLNDCRSVLNIIWSCLSTIFLCTWVSMHPNIPEPVNTKKMSFIGKCSHKISSFFKDKVPLFICALLIPEYILAWAIRQHLIVRGIVRQNRDLELTQAHGFFMIMGGFHYFTSSNNTADAHETTQLDPLLKGSDQGRVTKGEEVPVHPLSYENVLSMVRQNDIRLPTEEEIQDRSKSDWLAKVVVILQTCWFVMQCIARRVEDLPTTELEIITLAYAAMNFTIFMAWWNKPHNVDCPIRVFQKPLKLDEAAQKAKTWWEQAFNYIVGLQDDLVDLHKTSKVPIFYSGATEGGITLAADGILLVVGVVFGSIHCIAWSFTFPSHIEAVLWRASSITITSTPIFLFIVFLGVGILGSRFNVEEDLMMACWAVPMALSGVVYVAARFTTIILAFMSLSSPPPGVFKAVDWTIRFPHFS